MDLNGNKLFLIFILGVFLFTFIDTKVFFERDFISYLFINIFEVTLFIAGIMLGRLERGGYIKWNL